MAHVRHPTRGCGGPGQQHHSQSRDVEEQRYVCTTTTHKELRDAGLGSSVELGLSVVDVMWLAFVGLTLVEACVLELTVRVDTDPSFLNV